MRSILFFPDRSESVNKRVQTKVAKHLFIFCNYNPNSLKIFSEDSKLLVASLNSYKLLIDCNVMRHLKQAAKDYRIQYDYKSYESIIKTVSNIRTNLGHNVNELNGDEESILQFQNWLQRVTGKRIIQTASDYSKAIIELERLLQEAISIINNFIDNVSTSPHKSDFIKKWEDGIIGFYCKGNYDIIRNQLRLSYRTVAYNDVRLSGSRFRIDIYPKDIAIWVRNRMLYKPENQKRFIEDTVSEYGSKLDPKTITQMYQKIKGYEQEISRINKEVADFNGCGMAELSDAFKYYNYFVKTFRAKISKYLPTIIQNKQTMFPQDMLQWIIDVELIQP